MKIKPPKGYKFGKAQPQWKCCRTIRLVAAKEVGEILEGCNSTTQENEMWMAIKINPKYGESILQQLLSIKTK